MSRSRATLTPLEGRKVDRAYEAATHAHARASAQLGRRLRALVAAGAQPTAIAERLGVAKSTLYVWLAAGEEEPAAGSLPAGADPRTPSDSFPSPQG